MEAGAVTSNLSLLSTHHKEKRSVLWEKGASLPSAADAAPANVTTESTSRSSELTGRASNQSIDLYVGKGTNYSANVGKNRLTLIECDSFLTIISGENYRITPQKMILVKKTDDSPKAVKT